jgi:O-antigen/teichoic acid export membrane protein
VDRLLVGYFLPASENGLYQAASQISVIFVIILYSFNAILAPMFADFYANKEFQNLNETFLIATKWGLYLSLPMFLVVCFSPYDLLSIAFGNEYSGAWLALVVLSVGQIINVGTGAVALLLPITGNHKPWMVLSIFGLIFNLVLCTILIPAFGIVGAAFGTSISLSIMYFIGLLWMRNKLKLWPYDKRYLKGGASFLFSVTILLIFKNVYIESNVLSLLLLILLSFLSFFGMLVLLGLDDEDRHVIVWLRRRQNLQDFNQ